MPTRLLAFATAPLAVTLVAWTVERSGEFVWSYLLIAALLALAFAAATALPGARTPAIQPGGPNASSPIAASSG